VAQAKARISGDRSIRRMERPQTPAPKSPGIARARKTACRDLALTGPPSTTAKPRTRPRRGSRSPAGTGSRSDG
jgi:hypothetical protein